MSQGGSKVSAARGWHWLVQAVTLVSRHAGVFGAMGLIVAVIYIIPLLGGLIMLILGPALIAGSIIAARDADHGGRPGVGQLFALFQEDGRTREALKLCIPLVAGKVLASFVIGIGMARVLLRAGLDMKAIESQPEVLIHALQGSFGDLVWWLLVALLIMLAAWAFSVSAIARVALDRAEPFAAMAESFRLSVRNAGAWLLAGFALMLGVFVVSIPLLLGAHLLLAQMLINVLVYSLLGPLLYFAWRDLCQTSEHSAPTPPPSPRPSGTFEA